MHVHEAHIRVVLSGVVLSGVPGAMSVILRVKARRHNTVWARRNTTAATGQWPNGATRQMVLQCTEVVKQERYCTACLVSCSGNQVCSSGEGVWVAAAGGSQVKST